jgi:hypothetical protein
MSKYKILFIHIPKTGGTTIGNIFHPHLQIKNNPDKKYSNFILNGSVDVEHDYYRNYAKLNDLSDYFVFTFVRNPYSRLFSLWRQCCDEYNHTNGQIKKIISCDIEKTETIKYCTDRESKPMFNNFIETLQKEKKQLHLLGNTQYSMIKKSEANFIGKFETFDRDLRTVIDLANNFISKRENCNKEIFQYKAIHTNKRSKNLEEYLNFYSQNSINIVNNLYHNDFNEFSYLKK